jgi:hypothetical protein
MGFMMLLACVVVIICTLGSHVIVTLAGPNIGTRQYDPPPSPRVVLVLNMSPIWTFGGRT